MGKKSLGSEKEGRKGLETERSIKVSRGGVGKQTEGNKAAQENCGVAFIFPPFYSNLQYSQPNWRILWNPDMPKTD